jgi:putative membrane protein
VTTEDASDRVVRSARRLSPLTPLVRSFVLVAAVLVSTWDDLIRGDLGPFAWVLLLVAGAGLVLGFASWLRTTYWVESDELRVDTGVVSRQSRRIRVDRLQGIDIVQPFVARLFGLAELRMDVAGGGDREGSLAFLPLAEAEELRETLLARRDLVRGAARPDTDSAPDTAAGGRPEGRAPVPEVVVARLDPTMLVVSLLLSPESVLLVLFGAALVVVFAVFGQMGGVAGLLPIVLGFAVTQFRRLSAYYGFTVTAPHGEQAPARLQVRRGLFELSTQTVTLSRVQGVVVSEPLMWRALGWARLDVSVAGHARHDDDSRPSASTMMPVAPREQVLALARTLLADSGSPDPAAVELAPPPARARWVVPVRRHFLAGGVGEQLIVSREGLLRRRTHVVPHARVQSLQLQQGPWQRRLRLADLRVDSPPGPVGVRLRHRDTAEARRLMDEARVLGRSARARRSS